MKPVKEVGNDIFDRLTGDRPQSGGFVAGLRFFYR